MPSRLKRDRLAASWDDTEPSFDLVPRKGAGAHPIEPEQDDYHPGDVIAGKYELVRLLGRGGMSAVWVVQNLVLDAQFALKLIHNEDHDEHAGERMLREARSVARLDHPAIIRMFDFGVTESGDPFLVMELLTGASLRERLRQVGRLDPVEAVRLLLPVAEALSVAHAHGIVHRDLKPDNIVCVTLEGGRTQPKIIDFGIAKQVGEESRITQTGMVLGSPEYMSPEQALGLFDVDYRTDIWSFSIMLYEAVTGATPFFQAGDPMSILRDIVDRPIPPISTFGIRDPELWSILSRGLQKTLDGRWQDMHAYGEALARWLIHHGVEEDVCMQSVRMMWLGVTSPSAPPVAVDSRSDVRAQLAAFDEQYVIPKKSGFRTTAALLAGFLTLAGVSYAGFRLAYVPTVKQPTTTEPEPPKATAAAPLDVPPPPSAEPAAEPEPSVEQPAAEPPPKPEAPKPAAEPARERHASRAAKPRKSPSASKKTETKEPPDLFPSEAEPLEPTPLPDVKPPPDFNEKPSSKPSDNPYRDDDQPSTSVPSDNPY